jgi:hypothetical protein
VYQIVNDLSISDGQTADLVVDSIINELNDLDVLFDV